MNRSTISNQTLIIANVSRNDIVAMSLPIRQLPLLGIESKMSK